MIRGQLVQEALLQNLKGTIYIFLGAFGAIYISLMYRGLQRFLLWGFSGALLGLYWGFTGAFGAFLLIFWGFLVKY